MAKKRRKSSKKRRKSRKRGMGSTITVRRAGMGMFGKGPMGSAMPGLLGGATTALIALGLRYFVNPAQGNVQKQLVKWSWLFGHVGGLAVAGLLYAMKGSKSARVDAATQAAIGATTVGLFGWGSDWVMREKGMQIAAAFADAAVSEGTGNGTAGMGAIVFQRMNGGMGTIVPEYKRMSGGMGSYGETVSLQGLDTGVFGTPGF